MAVGSQWLGGRFVATDTAIVNHASALWTRRIADYFTIADRFAFESFSDCSNADVELRFAHTPLSRDSTRWRGLPPR
jgi:hypothetical protein